MNYTTPRHITVFLASPGDVQAERDAFIQAIQHLNATRSDVSFEALAWERLGGSSGTRPQSLINELVDKCDVFVLLMFRTWGRPANDSPIASSYTEEEFKRAAARFNQTQAPEIFCFFKQVELETLADAGPQLQQVLRFRQSVEESHQVLYRSFTTTDNFSDDLSDHLLRYVEGRLPTPRTLNRQILLSIPENTGSTPDEWRAAEMLTEQAVLAAHEGRMDEASVLFATVSQQTTDVRLLAVAEEYFRRRGEEITALSIADKRLVLTRDRRKAALQYIATAPSMAQEAAANALPHLPRESHAIFREIASEIFDSPNFKSDTANYLAEHLTVHELLALTRFFRGEGKSIAVKAGRYIGDATPRAMAQLNARLRERGVID
jgi:hypothetical protein